MKAWEFRALLYAFALSLGQATDNTKTFPIASESMLRFVLQLPRKADESALKEGLIIGKTVDTDAQNRYVFGGKIESEIIEGCGFTRYMVSELGPMAGTRMAVDPSALQVARFIALGGDPYLIRYHSRLPEVVNYPEGVEVCYRIRAARAQTETMKMG